MDETLEIYPPLPPGVAGSAPGEVYRVSAAGRPVPVERYAGASYVRFAFRGHIDLELEVDGPVGPYRILPVAAVAGAVAGAGGLRLALAAPSSFVVRTGDREPLFVLADPPQAPPAPGDPGVVALEPAGAELATARVQAAIDRAGSAAPGGTVLLLPGRHLSGTLALRSGVTLHLAAGALLEGSPDPADYPLDPGRAESGSDASLPPDARYWGRTMTFSRLLLVDGASDVRIRGQGTIAGNGRRLRMRQDAVPNLVRVRRSRRVTIEDVLLRDAAAWTVHLLASEDVRVANVKIVNDRDNLNTDGIDPDMCSRVTIERSFVWTKDDAICVKASGNGGLSGDVADVRVTGCVVSSRDAALKVGTESAASRFADVTFEDCTVFDSGRAMSVVVRDGAAYERIAFRRIHVVGVDHLVEQVIGVRDPEAALGSIRDLSFEDVTAPGYRPPASAWTWYAQFRPDRPTPGSDVPVFAGADPDHALDGLLLRNVVVDGRRLVDAASAREAAGLTIGAFVRDVRIE